MPNYLGNSRTANVIFFPWQKFPGKKIWSHCKKNQMRLFWVVFRQCVTRLGVFLDGMAVPNTAEYCHSEAAFTQMDNRFCARSN